MTQILSIPAKPYVTIIAMMTLLGWTNAFSQVAQKNKNYSAEERRSEEMRIQQKIEERLDWKTRAPEKLDDVPDAERMLIGGLNESILLRNATGERFGLFESFDDSNGQKIIEIRLHKKNKLTDRAPIYSPEICDKFVNISANQVEERFVVYTLTCSSKKYGIESTPYLFDYASRNFYQLAMLDYDAIENKAPKVKYLNGAYMMKWQVRLRGKKNTSVVNRNFKIQKNPKGVWEATELPPIDNEAAGITALSKLPIKPEYDLPAYVADWGPH